MTKAVTVKWGKPVPPSKRFERGQQLLINGKIVGAFYGNEEDRSLSSVVEVLEHLARAGAIEYTP